MQDSQVISCTTNILHVYLYLRLEMNTITITGKVGEKPKRIQKKECKKKYVKIDILTFCYLFYRIHVHVYMYMQY